MSDDEETISEWRGIAATIVLINAFDPSKKGTSAVAHAATLRMVRQYLRDSASHLIGVCFYGVEDTNTSAVGHKSVVDVFPLSTPSLDDYKKLRDASSIVEAKDLNMSDVLWHCSKMFSNCKKQLVSRTVVILSCLDEPPVQSDQKPALKRVVDLVDANIDVKLVNISNDQYEIHEFYQKFLIEANKGGEFIPPKPLWDPKEIEKVMHQITHRHLAVANLKFEIGDRVTIGVGVYNLLTKSGYSKTSKVNLEQESNVKIAVINKTMKIDTSAPESTPMDINPEEPKPMPLLKSEVLHYQFFGGERVEFTDAEKKQLNNPFGPPRIKLLGFKPASTLCKEKWFLKSGQFLYPTESKIEGSTVVFKALYQACIEMNVVAICIMCTRVNSRFFLAALSPCTHPLGLDVEIGFNIVQIPLAENVRNLPSSEDNEISVTNEQKTLMKNILQELQFEYTPEMFENPKHNSEYRAVEAIALEDKDLEPFTDTTIPNLEKFQNLPEKMFEDLFGDMYIAVAPKRPATSSNGSTYKRVKTDIHIDEHELNERIKYQTVNKYNVAQLKDIVRAKMGSNAPGLTGLKKQDLVELVYRCAGN